MRKQSLTKPKLTTRTFALNGFSNNTSLAVNFTTDEYLILTGAKSLMFGYVPEQINQVVKVDQTYFFISKNAVKYQFDGSYFTTVPVYGPETPLLLSVMKDGKKEIVAINKEGARFLSDIKTVFDVPYGERCLVLWGRLFIANGKNLYFGGPFNFSDASVRLENQGFISFGYEDGNIVGLCAFVNELIVLTERAIYKLTLSDDDFIMEKANLPPLNIQKDTVVGFGDRVIFVNDNHLCEYKKGGLVIADGIFNSSGFICNGKAVKNMRNNILPIYDKNNQNLLYIRDVATGAEKVVSSFSNVVGDGGLIVDTEGRKLYLLDDEGDYQDSGVWESKSFDFGVSNKKTLIEISLYVSKDALLTVKGDFGERKYALKAGHVIKRINLYSRSFVFLLTSAQTGFYARDMKLKYRVTGE